MCAFHTPSSPPSQYLIFPVFLRRKIREREGGVEKGTRRSIPNGRRGVFGRRKLAKLDGRFLIWIIAALTLSLLARVNNFISLCGVINVGWLGGGGWWFPTSNGGMRNGSSVGIRTRYVHIFARLAPIWKVSRCLLLKISASELSLNFIECVVGRVGRVEERRSSEWTIVALEASFRVESSSFLKKFFSFSILLRSANWTLSALISLFFSSALPSPPP